MKNILNLYLIIFCLFFVAGCSSDDDAATVKLTIIKSDLDMKASGGTGTVECVILDDEKVDFIPYSLTGNHIVHIKLTETESECI